MKHSKKRGWVRLHRKIDESELWFLEPFTKAQAWVDLFLNANHKDGSISIRGNIIDIKRGQIGWSELTMAKRWTWSKGKVRRFLKWLETKQQTIQQKSSLTTVITILNYEEHQQDDTTDDTAERQQKDSRRYTNKNEKNEKNEKKREGARARAFSPPTLEMVSSYCKARESCVDPQHFIDRNIAVGWKIGKNPMKDWKGAIRTWEAQEKKWAKDKPQVDKLEQEAIAMVKADPENAIFDFSKKYGMEVTAKYKHILWT